MRLILRKISREHYDEIVKLLRSNNSCRGIARKYGYDATTIRYHRIRLGIPKFRGKHQIMAEKHPKKLHLCLECDKQISRYAERCRLCRMKSYRKEVAGRPVKVEYEEQIRPTNKAEKLLFKEGRVCKGLSYKQYKQREDDKKDIFKKHDR